MSVTSIFVAVFFAMALDYQHLLDRLRSGQDVPGLSAVVIRQDEVLFAGASGLADIEAGREMTADTVLYAGSLTKIMTAVLALQLVDDGRLSLHGTALEVAQPVNVGISPFHLLTHTSGLSREGDFGYWFSAAFPDAAALADYVENAELVSRPGEQTHYSNIGYAALGTIIEKATGQSFGEALRVRVLLPLGMISSGAPGPAPGVSRGYTPAGRLVPNDDRPFAGVGHRVGGRHLREYHEANAMAPAFGAYTTAHDMGQLIRLLLGYGPAGVIAEDSRRQMLTPQQSGRGLGLRIGRLAGRTVARHDGWFAAHRSHVLLDLEAAVGVAVFANSDNAAPATLAVTLLEAALVTVSQPAAAPSN